MIGKRIIREKGKEKKRKKRKKEKHGKLKKLERFGNTLLPVNLKGKEKQNCIYYHFKMKRKLLQLHFFPTL